MASQALMCERKALPRPWPSEAPFTSPAMSTTLRKAGTLLQSESNDKQSQSNGEKTIDLAVLSFGGRHQISLHYTPSLSFPPAGRCLAAGL